MSAVFAIDKGKVRQSFAAASLSYDGVANLQRAVGKELLGGIDAGSLTGTVLDLGCGTGFLTGELLAQSAGGQMLALDIALPMLHRARTKLFGLANASFICADAERLPLQANSVDNVFSNLALQWCRNLPVVFRDMRRILKPGGRLQFSTFGPKTLQELKKAWAEVDHYKHVNEFYGEDALWPFLEQAGFTEIQINSKIYRTPYCSVMALMRELKQIGAHNVAEGRNKRLTTKSQMQAMMAAYEMQDLNSWISATYEVITVSAKA